MIKKFFTHWAWPWMWFNGPFDPVIEEQIKRILKLTRG